MVRYVDSAEHFLVRKYGTRGVCLWLLSIPWTTLGTAFILAPMERFSKPGPGGPLDILDSPPGVWFFSSIWLIGGIGAMVCAAIRPRICRDDWGFVSVVIPPFLWGCGYFWSQFAYIISDGEQGRGSAYIALVLYWSFALLLVFLSKRLPDSPEGPCWGRRK